MCMHDNWNIEKKFVVETLRLGGLIQGLKNRRTDVIISQNQLGIHQASRKTYDVAQLLHVSFTDDEQRTFCFDIALCLIQYMACISCVVITRNQINIIENIGTNILLIFTLDIYWFRSRTAYVNIDGASTNLATECTTSYSVSLSETFFNPCN